MYRWFKGVAKVSFGIDAGFFCVFFSLNLQKLGHTLLGHYMYYSYPDCFFYDVLLECGIWPASKVEG